MRPHEKSASELKTEFLIARRLGYLGERDYFKLRAALGDIGKMLAGLINRLKNVAR